MLLFLTKRTEVKDVEKGGCKKNLWDRKRLKRNTSTDYHISNFSRLVRQVRVGVWSDYRNLFSEVERDGTKGVNTLPLLPWFSGMECVKNTLDLLCLFRKSYRRYIRYIHVYKDKNEYSNIIITLRREKSERWGKEVPFEWCSYKGLLHETSK